MLKKKKITAIVLAIVLLCGIACSLIFVFYKPAIVINDLTQGQQSAKQKKRRDNR